MGQNRRFLVPRDLEIWRMTLKNNRTSVISNIKLCASFSCHMWIQPGVTVQKRLSGVMTFVALTFDLHLFAWTSRLSTVINTRMIQCQEHCQKGVTDGQTDRRTDGQTKRSVLRAAWSQLEIHCTFRKYESIHYAAYTQYNIFHEMKFWSWSLSSMYCTIFDMLYWPTLGKSTDIDIW